MMRVSEVVRFGPMRVSGGNQRSFLPMDKPRSKSTSARRHQNYIFVHRKLPHPIPRFPHHPFSRSSTAAV